MKYQLLADQPFLIPLIVQLVPTLKLTDNMKRIQHWLAHKLSLNYGIVETFYQGTSLYVCYKCTTCGKKEVHLARK